LKNVLWLVNKGTQHWGSAGDWSLSLILQDPHIGTQKKPRQNDPKIYGLQTWGPKGRKAMPRGPHCWSLVVSPVVCNVTGSWKWGPNHALFLEHLEF
jgi:hypothetical protein